MNVQQTIIKGIKEQLFLQNYLVLPDFGGFVLKSRPAHLSASGGMVFPAAKTVSFNSQLKQNDGVLTFWLQKQLGCTADEALKHLKDFSDFCGSILNTKRRISLEGIGFFYLDFENNICFEPQAESNFLTNSFGLTAISLKPLEQPVKEIKKEKVFVDRVITTQSPETVTRPEKKVVLRRLVTPTLLSLVLLSFLFLLLSNRKISGELRASLMGENTSTVYSPVSYPDLELVKPIDVNSTYVADANGVAIIQLNSSKLIAVKVLDNGYNLSESKSRQGYEVVLGCFTVLSNAKKLIHKLGRDNVKAFVSGQNNKGMFVVSYGTYTSKEVASEKAEAIKTKYPHAWVKKSEF